MESTVQHRVSIQQVVSTHPTRFTVLTLRDLLQVLILTKAALQSRAVGHLVSLTLNTNISTILGHTAKRVLDILPHRTLTTVRVAMQCLQIPHTQLASPFIPAHRLMHGRTQVHMCPHSNSGSRASSLHKIIMEILSVQHILQHGQELELVLLHLTSPRTNSTSVPHRWDLNRSQRHPQIPRMESLLK